MDRLVVFKFCFDKLYRHLLKTLDVNKCHSDVTHLYYTDGRFQMEALSINSTYAFAKRELYEILRG